jgi:uncharacterized glyoxalase superfamily protein PhnB
MRAAKTKTEIAFVDCGIDDVSALVAGLRPEAEPILLSPDEPAIRQMARAVRGRRGLRAIHVIAHGRPGEVSFAAGALSLETVDGHAGDLAEIGQVLGPGSFQVWTCESALGMRGAAFVNALARVMGVKVAASTARVGARSLGGRWELDAGCTDLEVAVPLTAAAAASYARVMAPAAPTVASVVATGAGITAGGGDLITGDAVTLTVNMSQPVAVIGGAPTLLLNDGGTATYTDGSDTNTLDFSYTVGPGQSTPNLAVTAVDLNGATVTNSPLATVTAGSGQSLTDANGHVWSFGAAGGYGYVILRDGIQYANGSGVTLVQDVIGAVWARNDLNGWYQVTATGWTGQSAGPPSPVGNQLANLAGAAATFAGLQVNPSNSQGPTVTSVAASGNGITAGAGDLGAGQVVTLTVTLSGPVTVTGGTPALSLNDGGIATYTGGSGTNALTFSYTVGAGQNTADLAVTAVNLNGATVTSSPLAVVTAGSGQSLIDAKGHGWSFGAASGYGSVILRDRVQYAGGSGVTLGKDVNGAIWTQNNLGGWYNVTGAGWTGPLPGPSLAPTGGPGQVANLAGAVTTLTGPLQIDTATPTVTQVVPVPGSGTENAGNAITFTLDLSEAVTVVGTPTLSLNDGGIATYTSGSGTNALTFSYTVGAADSSVPALAITQVNLPNGATIKDAAGNAANLAGAATTFAGLQVNPSSSQGPTVTSVAASGNGITAGAGDLGAGQVVTLTVTLSGPVAVTGGTPTLSLNDGGTATYTGGSGTNALTFSYTVGPGQNTPDLAVTAVNLNGAAVTTNLPTTVTPGSGQSLTDAKGHVWSFDTAANGFGSAILRDGVQYAGGFGALLSEDVNGVIWTRNNFNNWFVAVPSGWAAESTGPTLAPTGPGETANLNGAVSTLTGTLQIDTSVRWANGISGIWQTASDWNLGTLPTAANGVLITAPGTYTVTDPQSTTVYSVATAPGATLDITGGTFTTDAGTGSGVNAGTIRVESGAALDILAGSVTNTGAVQGVLANSGTVNLTNGARITGGALVNSGMVNVISGSTGSLVSTSLSSAGNVAGSLALDGSGYFSGPPTPTQNGNGTVGVALTTTKPNDVIIKLVSVNGAITANDGDDHFDTANLSWHFVGLAGTNAAFGATNFYEYYAIAPQPLSGDFIGTNIDGTASNVVENVFAISGANTSAPFDPNSSIPATPINSTGAITTSNANDFIFAGYDFAHKLTPNPGPGWTAIDAIGNNFLSEYQIVSATQSGLVATASSTDESQGIVSAVVQSPSVAAGVTVHSGSTLDLNNSTIAGNTLTVSGIVDVTGGNTSTLSGVTVNIGPLALDGNVYSTEWGNTLVNSGNVTLTTANANDVIVVDVLSQRLQGGTISVADSANLIWHQRAVVGNGPYSVYEYYAIAPTALSNDTITVNLIGGSTKLLDVNAFGVTGANTSSPFDSNVSSPVTPAASTGSISTGNANDFIFAGYAFSTTAVPGAGSGWTALNANGSNFLSEYQIVSKPQVGLVATASATDETGGIVDAIVQASGPTATARLTVDAGSTLNLKGTTIVGGTLSNSGTVDSTGTSVLQGVAVINSGLLEATGGSLTISPSSFANNGLVEANGGNVIVAGSVGGNAEIVGNSTFEIGSSSTAAVTFASGSTGTLKLDDSQQFTGTVAGLSTINTLDLADINFATAQTAFSGDSTHGTLTVTDGVHTAKIGLSGNYTSSTWTLSNDGHGGTDLVDPPAAYSTQDQFPKLCIDPFAGRLASTFMASVDPGVSPVGDFVANVELFRNYMASFTPAGFTGSITSGGSEISPPAHTELLVQPGLGQSHA